MQQAGTRTDFDDVLVKDPQPGLGSLADPHAHGAALDTAGFEPTSLLGMLHSMLRIRVVEEVIADLARDGVARTPCHLAIGQEAVPVGVSLALRATDSVYGGHRSHGHLLALGGSLQALLDEVLCRGSGASGGRGGSMHICAPQVGFVGSVPLVAATVPLAVGAGIASNFRGAGDVGVAYFGDGATEEGVVHESLNLARVLQAPTLFVCENNLFSSHLDIRLRQPSDRVSRYAEAHHVRTRCVDGNDVCAVARAAQELVTAARAGGGPGFLEAVTYRHRGHVGPNEDIDVGLRRRMEDVVAWKSRDPIARLKAALMAAGILTDAAWSDMEGSVRGEVAAATERALTQPFPDPSTVLDHVLAGPAEVRDVR